jgi:hypothetical protein
MAVYPSFLALHSLLYLKYLSIYVNLVNRVLRERQILIFVLSQKPKPQEAAGADFLGSALSFPFGKV